jgi:hypothetical protein
MADSEAEMMESAACGDAAALRTLLQRYGPRVGGEIESQIGPRWQSLLGADDVMQVTCPNAGELPLRTARARDSNPRLAAALFHAVGRLGQGLVNVLLR